MYKGKSFIGVIPARGGSKGIPHKNIREVNGKPLIQYSIEEANKSNYLDRIIVSTDDLEIERVAKKVGADVPFLRPKEYATDTAKTIDALIFTVNELAIRGFQYDYLVLLQPTQPLRKGWHIDEAIKEIVDRDRNSLVSVSEVQDHPILMRTINDHGELENILKISSTIRRQDFPTYYKVNGAIYINKLNENFTLNTSLNDNSLSYIMDKRYDIDIDEPIDLDIFKLLLAEGEVTGD
ncbi:acylneuraminate cytidylyltransferase family protein [Bacillus sp. UMB0893]|uniref:acylneuraminate cytidylyltransferase family protein n=1 Tax=Bacillus sp. UMB0893 TaxID=2066053 RepID=UPI000C76CE40|nr:acylneuraminate cytidylyltransferase family protein [Bacillus sp. UMB0893]PLR67929.1 acylneuraminate cytidylyltransferase [Bacillus sp. UMB0893]